MARSRTLGVLNIVGEVLITAGVVVLLYLAWQLWINNAVISNEQARIVQQSSGAWNKAGTTVAGDSSTVPAEEAPVLAHVSKGQTLGNLYIPRLGADSTRAISETVDMTSVLNRGYYGHYSQTQMPGEPGNFALAHHRGGWGSAFKQAQLIRTGDRIYLESKSGYYGYTVRNIEYVAATGVSVLNEVPGTNSKPGKQSYLTLTTCSPIDGNAERLVIYAVLDSYRSRSAGPFSDLAPMIKKA